MVLVFIFLGVVIFATLLSLVLLLSTIKIDIKGKWKRNLFTSLREKRKV